MKLNIKAHLDYTLDGPSDILLQLEAAPLADQNLISAHIHVPGDGHFARIPGEEMIGDRIWVRRDERLTVDYTSEIAIDRQVLDCGKLEQTPVHLLPGDIVKNLMGSRS
ncbi:MAG: transglutaminase family protein, partial [Pacificimonas sp.]